ncbi:MAG: hypothetical protein JSS79_15535 [Bacteroidetes bacterium]|nr:hypothetical protein [Bacteroidota bacterium]
MRSFKMNAGYQFFMKAYWDCRSIVFMVTLIAITPYANVFSQKRTESYLGYSKDVRKTLNPSTGMSEIDTLFVLHDLVLKRGSKWVREEIFSLDAEFKVELRKVGNKVHIIAGDTTEAVILSDSVIHAPAYINYVLVPLGQGIKVTPFNEQLLLEQENVRRKILFEPAITKREGKRYAQNACAISSYRLSDYYMQYGEIVYGNKRESNVMVNLLINGSVMQVVNISDSTLMAKEYSWKVPIGELVVQTSTYKRKPYPDSTRANAVNRKLEGRWTSSKVTMWQKGLERLDCSYNFWFKKGELLVSKDVKNVTSRATWDSLGYIIDKEVRFKNSIDTVYYSLNSSGDYFISDFKKHRASLRAMMIEKVDDTNLVVLVNDRWPTADGATGYMHWLRIELKKE